MNEQIKNYPEQPYLSTAEVLRATTYDVLERLIFAVPHIAGFGFLHEVQPDVFKLRKDIFTPAEMVFAQQQYFTQIREAFERLADLRRAPQSDLYETAMLRPEAA